MRLALARTVDGGEGAHSMHLTTMTNFLALFKTQIFRTIPLIECTLSMIFVLMWCPWLLQAHLGSMSEGNLIARSLFLDFTGRFLWCIWSLRSLPLIFVLVTMALFPRGCDLCSHGILIAGELSTQMNISCTDAKGSLSRSCLPSGNKVVGC